jgi:hypothetical protein
LIFLSGINNNDGIAIEGGCGQVAVRVIPDHFCVLLALRWFASRAAYLGGGRGSEDGIVRGRLSDPVRGLGDAGEVDS